MAYCDFQWKVRELITGIPKEITKIGNCSDWWEKTPNFRCLRGPMATANT